MKWKNIPISHIIALICLILAQILALGILSLEPPKILFRRNVIYMPFPIPLGLLYTLFLIPSIVFLIIYIILEIGTIELDTEDNILSIKKPFRSYKISLSEISFIGRARRRWVIWYMYAYFAYFLYYTWYWLIGSTGYEVFNRSFKSDLLGIYLNLGMSFIMLGLLPTIGMLVLIIRPRLAVIYDGKEVRFDVINRKKFLSNVFPKVEGKVIDYQPKTPLILREYSS